MAMSIADHLKLEALKSAVESVNAAVSALAGTALPGLRADLDAQAARVTALAERVTLLERAAKKAEPK